MATYYTPKIVTNGLVLALDAASQKSYPRSGTTWTDVSYNNYNGTLINSPTFSTNNGGSLVFDGVSSYVAVNSCYDFSISNKLTAMIWAKSNTSTWNDYGFLVSRRDQYIIHPNISGTSVSNYINNGSWNADTFTASNITSFNLYGMTWNGSAISSYFNGLRMSSTNVAGTIASNTGETDIGKDHTLSRYFNGSAGLVLLYNRALSDSEMLQNYNATKNRYGL